MSELLKRRISIHQKLSKALAELSDEALATALEQAEVLSLGIGGKKRLLKLAGQPIFVKEVPLTSLELRPENYLSTANHFNLPLYYQYGLSSAGFGAWRELKAQEQASQWVLEGACPAFPLLYHWRVVKRTQQPVLSTDIQKDIERSVKYWGGSEAIRERLLAKHLAPADVVLFMEYQPECLDKWLGLVLHQPEVELERVLETLPSSLLSAIHFMNSQGMLHFDAHLNNILSDGQNIFIADFGLALCSSFDLSVEERNFYEVHKDYDLAMMILSLAHRTLAAHYGTKERNQLLEAFARGEDAALASASLRHLLQHSAAVSVLMKFFNAKLLFETKGAAYPQEELALACRAFEREYQDKKNPDL